MPDEGFMNLTDSMLYWDNYTPNTVLNKDINHIFRIPLSAFDKIEPKQLLVLSTEEITKASRFRKTDDAKRYVIGKYFLRIILSSILGIDAKKLTFSTTGNKKPYIEGCHFNISHSGQFTTIAISPMPVGIDIEFVNIDFDFSSLLQICFTDSELKQIKNAVDFYTFWTRKEAVLKASGEGLIENLHDIDCLKDVVERNNTKLLIISKRLNQEHIISLATNTLHNTNKYWHINI